MGTITIELCKEDRDRLDIIINALKETLKAEEPKKVEAPKPEPKEEQKAVEAPKPEPKEEPKAEEAAPCTTDAPAVTVAELQSKVVQLVSAGKKEETREVIMKYAKSVSEIPEDKRAEVLDKLKELEG